jgi:hypothetical protein
MLEAWTRKRDTGQSAIERLFNRMGRLYLTKWTHSFKGDADIKSWALEWSQEFVRHGITPHMILPAIERCSTEYEDWPPNCPQLIAMCRPVIDYEQAFNEAVQEMRKRSVGEDRWAHPAIYWAAMDFGWYDLRQATYGQAAHRWKKLLDKHLMAGCPDVPKYVPQLAAPARDADGKAMTSAEARAAAMAATKAMADKKPSRNIAVERARDIMARHAAGETILVYYVEHAREVLARLESPEPRESDADNP